jgi:hypothetical protein
LSYHLLEEFTDGSDHTLGILVDGRDAPANPSLAAIKILKTEGSNGRVSVPSRLFDPRKCF